MMYCKNVCIFLIFLSAVLLFQFGCSEPEKNKIEKENVMQFSILHAHIRDLIL
jgi:hypothetical protein